MGVYGGPNIVEDGLVLCLDASNVKCISPAANDSFNGSNQFIRNIVNRSETISTLNGIKLGNLQYYTVFSIDYPEYSYGGSAASREGLTAGFNVTSGSKIYDASRALHLWVWNNDTNNWVSSSYFNGASLSGHCYDSYNGNPSWQTEVAQFVTDFNTIKNTFPNCTYIATGSHRDSGHTTDKINVLLNLGAPTNVSSLLGSDPEWILVGKPGLGAGNAFVWSYENYSIDPSRVAHAIFPLPINVNNPSNYLEFDGVDNTINFEYDLRQNFTYECWALHNVVSGFSFLGQGVTSTQSGLHIWFTDATNLRFGMFANDTDAQSITTQTGVWYHYVFTYNHTTFLKQIFRNGVQLTGTPIQTQTAYIGTGTVRICATYSSGGNYANGRISNAKLYNRVLSPQEIQKNYNSTKSRYGL